MWGVFRGGRMPRRKIPTAPRTRGNAPGAKAGCAFFAPGFFAQAKKGGSRRHGAKALDLCVAVARQDRSRAARCARALIRPPGTFSRKREKGSSRELRTLRGRYDRQVDAGHRTTAITVCQCRIATVQLRHLRNETQAQATAAAPALG